MSKSEPKEPKNDGSTSVRVGQKAVDLAAFLENTLQSSTEYSIIGKDLEPFGYRIVEAMGVDEELRILEDKLPDLILTDLHMPRKVVSTSSRPSRRTIALKTFRSCSFRRPCGLNANRKAVCRWE